MDEKDYSMKVRMCANLAKSCKRWTYTQNANRLVPCPGVEDIQVARHRQRDDVPVRRPGVAHLLVVYTGAHRPGCGCFLSLGVPCDLTSEKKSKNM